MKFLKNYIKNIEHSEKNCSNKKAVFNDNIYKKIKEAENEMNNTSKRYSKEEILDSINNIIG